MNRRDALLAVSGTLAGAALLAPRRPALAQAAQAPAPTMRLDPTEYRQGTLIGGAFTRQASEAALTQAAHAKVRQFAQFEVAEQIAVAQALTDETDPTPPPLDPTHAAALASLRSRSGADFDATYVQTQIAGHRELLLIQQNYLNSPPLLRDLEHVAVLSRPSIQMHLTLLTELQAMLRT